jgi:hypothetical protein
MSHTFKEKKRKKRASVRDVFIWKRLRFKLDENESKISKVCDFISAAMNCGRFFHYKNQLKTPWDLAWDLVVVSPKEIQLHNSYS